MWRLDDPYLAFWLVTLTICAAMAAFLYIYGAAPTISGVSEHSKGMQLIFNGPFTDA